MVDDVAGQICESDTCAHHPLGSVPIARHAQVRGVKFPSEEAQTGVHDGGAQGQLPADGWKCSERVDPTVWAQLADLSELEYLKTVLAETPPAGEAAA